MEKNMRRFAIKLTLFTAVLVFFVLCVNYQSGMNAGVLVSKAWADLTSVQGLGFMGFFVILAMMRWGGSVSADSDHAPLTEDLGGTQIVGGQQALLGTHDADGHLIGLGTSKSPFDN
jgi:hypothetical protein